ncbi:MAG: undecaprenyldiphospho-muramoylpentapeptide beta-N-acetylglucosaminyltransferase [Proteobacteria bacterium]|nr:undecaprenyldiphospho-muramoylpentapeptide beta-N-acetylglucosaminyltransferase [Pseudomonadota bacterium]
MKFVMMAGGTGGHIFPGISVAKALQKRGHTVYWLGAKGGMEERIVRQYGIRLKLLKVKPLRGKGLIRKLVTPFRVLTATWQARRFLKKEGIDVAISMGGYVAAPGGLATRFCGTRLVVHEQNSLFGMTNRILAKHADQVLTGFDLSGLYRSQWVGNPVRGSIVDAPKKDQSDLPFHVLIMGGSLGAQSLNRILPISLKEPIEQGRIQVWHQCGKNNKEQTNASYGELKTKIRVDEFIHNMSKAYRWADVCIARAGALTLAELTAMQLPALLVPFPHAVDDHQTKNAMYLVNHGAALIWSEKSSVEELNEQIEQLFDAKQQQHMRQSLKQIYKPDVANRIADICEQVAA